MQSSAFGVKITIQQPVRQPPIGSRFCQKDKTNQHMARFSPLKVRVFDSCRLRYRYQYVDKLPARLRIQDTAGTLVHRVLCDFFMKVPQEDRSVERLLGLFRSGWDSLSPRYRQMEGVGELRSEALQQLDRFARQHDLRAQPFAVEPYFQVDLVPGVTLFGRLDRIDQEPDGSLHIIDYKTGAQPDEVDAGQLRLYAIMVDEKLGQIVSRVSFWFLDDGSTWTSELSDEDKRQTRAELFAAVDEMQTVTEFPATIASHCAHCPYLYTCERRDDIRRRREAEGW